MTLLAQHDSSGRKTLTENIGHLILEVLGGNQRVKQLLATLNHSVDFTTSTAEIRVVVKRLPQVVEGLAARLGAGINEDANFRLQARGSMQNYI